MTAFYNEIDPFAAAWLRELIKGGHIADGTVDERDIRDLRPSDLDGFSQVHFFAGIGGWSYALRLAGWPDDRPVWTGSCPCQPFSAAGRGGGFADERHLWPAFFHLISECRPPVVFGEQVASKDGLAWFDLVHADLEGAGYAVGAADLCAAGVGAPHIRQRLWFVADAEGNGGWAHARTVRERALKGLRDAQGQNERRPVEQNGRPFDSSANVELADAERDERRQVGAQPGRSGSGSGSQGMEQRSLHGGALALGHAEGREQRGFRFAKSSDGWEVPARRSGAWDDVTWLPCRDGKARPTQPRIFPLAHGIPNRVGTLRGAGNAIVPIAGAEFIRAADGVDLGVFG